MRMYSKNTQIIQGIYVFLQNLYSNYHLFSLLYRDFVLLTSCDKFLHTQKIFCDFFMYFVQTFLQYFSEITAYFKRMHRLTLFLNLKQAIWQKFFLVWTIYALVYDNEKQKTGRMRENFLPCARLIFLFSLACCNRFFLDASLRQLRQKRTCRM